MNLTRSFSLDIEENKSKHDHIKELINQTMRDSLNNFDLTNGSSIKLYEESKLNYIAILEGKSPIAYDDAASPRDKYRNSDKIFEDSRVPVDKITVGYGFNMDRKEARQEWEKILGNIVILCLTRFLEDCYVVGR